MTENACQAGIKEPGMSVEAYVKNKQAAGSNYDAALQKAAGLFVAHGMDDIIRKTGCGADGDYLYTELLCRSFRISRRDGKAEQLCSDGIKPAGYDTSMILYDLLAFSDENARASGDYIPLQNHSKVQNVHSYAGEGAFEKYDRIFTGHCDKLERVCRDLGGVPFGKGDVSLLIPYWRDLKIGLSFWDADEEFSPSLNLFYDTNAGQYMHYETMWYSSDDFLTEIADKVKQNRVGGHPLIE